MTAMDTAFWTELDAKIAAGRTDNHRIVSAQIVEQATATDAQHSSQERITRALRARSDWTGVLDTIAAAKVTSEQHKAELRNQAAAHAALLVELRRAQEQIRSIESILLEARAEGEAKARKAQAEAEARMQVVQEKADAAVQEAYDLMRAAELRATTAEDWLHRIEHASLDLFPSDYRAVA